MYLHHRQTILTAVDFQFFGQLFFLFIIRSYPRIQGEDIRIIFFTEVITFFASAAMVLFDMNLVDL